MRYVISSGWWCSGDNGDTREKLLGDDLLREKEFFRTWLDSIQRFSNPVKILVVDSDSPVKPELPASDRQLEFVSLDENGGHATNHSGKYSGYTRAIFAGMGYALACNVDYWVYVEQDALLYGEGIIEKAITEMKDEFLFGSGEGTPQVLQQSLIVMKTDFIPRFISNYTQIPYSDKEISPELKFAVSCFPYFRFIPKPLLVKKRRPVYRKLFFKLISRVLKTFIDKRSFSFGYGRSRPIDFSDDFFYFQHGVAEELAEYSRRLTR